VCGLQRGEFIHVLGDTHVYKDHIEPLKEQIKRIPNPFPSLEVNSEIRDIDQFKLDDFKLVGYNPQGKVKMKMAV
jgi:thymidylate synthase